MPTDQPQYKRAGRIDYHDAPKKSSIGCVLLGLFPFILVGGVFVAGALEESGNKVVGWLWIPVSIAVMLTFGLIRFRLSASFRDSGGSKDPGAATRSILSFVAMQILVLIVLGLIAAIFGHFSPFSGTGGDLR